MKGKGHQDEIIIVSVQQTEHTEFLKMNTKDYKHRWSFKQ
jgi:hypothetical protein